MGRNRLIDETSPYLLQHRDNPVHWWAWEPAALAAARDSGKPILLSIGYAACHWCHVMAHESFEDQPTAALMNELFVNIKVDREERPDLDAIYMSALHAMGEQGGWPLTMFLDGGGRPFWGGTYFPPQPRWGKPSFPQVLREISRIYREDALRVRRNAEILTTALAQGVAADSKPAGSMSNAFLVDVMRRLTAAVDVTHGGLQGAPKFPQWSIFSLLWRLAIRFDDDAARHAVVLTLTNICQGGIYDHLGGGFARYSVDERWLAPHFEKMLYDNALLIDLMTEVYRETGAPLFKQRIEETVAWLQREMVVAGGAFASSLDADSEGEEGKFYVWSPAEIEAVLGPVDAAFFSLVYDVSPGGNWESTTILNRLSSQELLGTDEEARLAALRGKLLAVRENRIRPGFDDKILADWNGLMIAALARASQVFERPDWLAMARQAHIFIRANLDVDGTLRHAWRGRTASAAAVASDFANLIWGALELFQATGEPEFLVQAEDWVARLDAGYWDSARGGYAATIEGAPDLIVRLRHGHDDATPNANAIMTANLTRLFSLTGKSVYAERAQATPAAFAAEIAKAPTGHCGLLAGLLEQRLPQHIVIFEADTLAGRTSGDSLMRAINTQSLPGAVIQRFDASAALPASMPVARPATEGAAAVVCIGTQCSQPLITAEAVADFLRKRRTVG